MLSTVIVAMIVSALPILEQSSTIEGNTSTPMGWLTHDDPILQFSIDYPSTWSIQQFEDVISFEIPETQDGVYHYNDFDIVTETTFTSDSSEYARDKLNEKREFSLKLIGLNETSINGQPATRAQYQTGQSSDLMTLSYYFVTKDYDGYALIYSAGNADFTRYLPEVERMINSFKYSCDRYTYCL